MVPTDIFRPTGAQVQKALKYYDLGVKLEILLFEMHSILFWISLIELASFSIATLFFLRFAVKGKNSAEAE